MELSEKNRSYFNSEAGKNRDQWTHSDGDRTIRIQNVKSSNPYATMKFDDVIHYKAPTRLWTNADGEEELENEESVEPEGEEAMVEEEFVDEELPKFRQLVRAKKLEMKAQYGKAHFATRRECKNVPYPGTCTKSVPYPCVKNRKVTTCYKNVPVPCTKYKEVCINVPYWVWGWRKKWREFKQAGGLAQLKMISKGMAPLYPPTDTGTGNTTTPTNTTTPRGGAGRNTGDGKVIGETIVRPRPTLDLGDGEVGQAGVAGNIIGAVLILGLVFGAIKMMK